MTILACALTAYCTLTYVAGAKWFLGGGSRGLGSWAAFVFSPVTVPLGLLVLIVVYP